MLRIEAPPRFTSHCPTIPLGYKYPVGHWETRMDGLMADQAEAKLDGKFRLVIPEEIRKKAKLNPSQRLILRYDVTGREVQLTIIPAKLVPE